jgi:hypothetical protein
VQLLVDLLLHHIGPEFAVWGTYDDAAVEGVMSGRGDACASLCSLRLCGGCPGVN